MVDSVRNRLEVTGIGIDGQEEDAKKLWEVWQSNRMDSESKLAHNSALTTGRAYAIVWPGRDGPTISLDNAEQMIVQYQEGSRSERVAALRRWIDEDTGRPYCTLYRPEGVYKFVGPAASSGYAGTQWVQRNVPNENWPLENPFNGDIPVVEIRVNGRLTSGSFPYARGEFESCLGLLDRINLLTFLGLVVAFWMGFPIRAVVGDKILRDDQGNALAPFKALANEVVQFENPAAKLEQFDAADRKNLSIYAELNMLAMLTHTPRHYFPNEGGISNVSADWVRADEDGLNAKVGDHKASLGDGWEDVFRLSGQALDTQIILPPSAEITWADRESRSLAERADAASKLAPIFPWQFVGEKAFGLTQDEIQRLKAMKLADPIAQIVKDAAGEGATPPAGTPAGPNGVPVPAPGAPKSTVTVRALESG